MSTISTTEHIVLGLLGEGDSHGFAIAKQLGPDSEVGRIYTVRRPLVYRALERLVAAGLAEAVATEPGESGPERVVHRITASGKQALDVWLAQPVDHIRDLRLDFLVKVALITRTGASPLGLIRSQRAALAPALVALVDLDADDPVAVWRAHNARAAGAFLLDLDGRYAG